MSVPKEREGASNNAGKSVEGGGLVVSGHPFQCSSCNRGEGIQRSIYHHLSP